MNRYLVTAVILLALFPAAGKVQAKPEQEYEKAAGILEENENEYLQARFTFIELKRKIREKLESLDGEAGDLIDERNRLREEILSAKKETEKIEEKVEARELRAAEISSFQASSMAQLIKEAEMKAPYLSYEDLSRLKRIQETIETGKDFTLTGRELTACLETIIEKTRQCVLEPGERLTEKNIPVQGTRIRMGGVFYGFLPERGGDSAVLLQTGKSTDSVYSWSEEVSGASRAMERFVRDVHNGEILSALPVDVMQSTAAAKGYGSGTVFAGFFDWFRSGGPVMYAVLAILGYALYITGERILVLRRNSVNADSLMKSVMEHAEKNNLQKVRELCSGSEGTLPRVIRSLIDHDEMKKNQAEEKLNEIMLHEIPLLEKHLPTLKSLGGLAPLLGLLGTVTGMISLFDVITAYGTGDPKLLAGGIAEALVTTEFGLIVAIPVLLAHRILLNRAESLITDIERYGLTLVNTVFKG